MKIRRDRTREEVEKNLACKKYKNISAWRKDNYAEYTWARNQDWYEEVIQKFGLRKHIFNRTRQSVEKNLARKKYKNIAAWTKDNYAEYLWALKQDWFEEVVQKYRLREKGSFTKDEILLFLYKNNITSHIQWRRMKGYGCSYSSKQDWYPECLEIIKLNRLRKKQKAA